MYLRNFEYCMKRYTIILASKRKSHLWQNINSLDCEPTIKVLWADCIVVTCCLWGGDVIPLACVDTISQSELTIVPLWPMRGLWLCHIVVTSVTLLTQSAICSLTLMDSAASKFYTNGHQGLGLTTGQWPGHLCSWRLINQREQHSVRSLLFCFIINFWCLMTRETPQWGSCTAVVPRL